MKMLIKKSLERIIESWFQGSKFKTMETGENYYNGKHDILFRTKKGIDSEGNTVDLKNTLNYKIVDNQFRGLLDQSKLFIIKAI